MCAAGCTRCSGYIPLGVSEAAGALVAFAGVGLLALARGVRRGQRSAWLVSILLLAGTVALHLVHHGDFVQSIAALALAVVLFWTRKSFRARFDLPSLRAGLATLLGGGLAVTMLGATVLWNVIPVKRGGRPISWPEAWWATVGRLAGIRTVAIDPRVDAFMYPALLAVGLGLASAALVLLFRPVVDRRRSPAVGPAPRRAPRTSYGAAAGARSTTSRCAVTSSYSWSATGSSPTRIYGGICLVSPDPICAPEERDELWSCLPPLRGRPRLVRGGARGG